MLAIWKNPPPSPNVKNSCSNWKLFRKVCKKMETDLLYLKRFRRYTGKTKGWKTGGMCFFVIDCILVGSLHLITMRVKWKRETNGTFLLYDVYLRIQIDWLSLRVFSKLRPCYNWKAKEKIRTYHMCIHA